MHLSVALSKKYMTRYGCLLNVQLHDKGLRQVETLLLRNIYPSTFWGPLLDIGILATLVLHFLFFILLKSNLLPRNIIVRHYAPLHHAGIYEIYYNCINCLYIIINSVYRKSIISLMQNRPHSLSSTCKL